VSTAISPVNLQMAVYCVAFTCCIESSCVAECDNLRWHDGRFLAHVMHRQRTYR
jgi:hypothetical protein